ncbi:MAG: hypothetical protein WCC87_23435 [Candidatus Korobacteraceae bacterium]
MKKVLGTIVCLLLVSAIALGQAKADRDVKRLQEQQRARIGGGYECGGDPILPTDGSSAQDYIGPTPNYYLLHMEAHHSYVAEMWDPVDSFIGGGAQLVLLSSPGCGTTLSTRDFVGSDPNLSNNFADRISWLQPADGDAVLQVNNLDTTGAFYGYVIRVTDTTLQDNYWTTNGNLATQFTFTNNTEQTLSGKLLVEDVTAGGVDYSAAVSVAPGRQTTEIVASTGIASSGLQVPANHVGRATFYFTGPAGGIMAEAFTITSMDVPITSIKFESKFSPH